MFNIRDFIMDTLKGMCGNYPDFQIKEYALNWYSRGKLTEDDLAELEEYLSSIEDEAPVQDEELLSDSSQNTSEDTSENAIEEVIEEAR